MAPRKKPHTEPVLDSKSDADVSSVQYTLPPAQFEHVILVLRKTKKTTARKQIKEAALENLERLGKKPDPKRAVKLTKAQQNIKDVNLDVQSLLIWMSRIRRGHRKAVGQLISIEASC